MISKLQVKKRKVSLNFPFCINKKAVSTFQNADYMKNTKLKQNYPAEKLICAHSDKEKCFVQYKDMKILIS